MTPDPNQHIKTLRADGRLRNIADALTPHPQASVAPSLTETTNIAAAAAAAAAADVGYT